MSDSSDLATSLADVIANLDGIANLHLSNFAGAAYYRDPADGDHLAEALKSMPDTPRARRLQRALRDLRQATTKLHRAAETYDGCEAALIDAAAAYADELRAAAATLHEPDRDDAPE